MGARNESTIEEKLEEIEQHKAEMQETAREQSNTHEAVIAMEELNKLDYYTETLRWVLGKDRELEVKGD